MNILTIVSFITNFFTVGSAIGDWFLEILHKMLLFFDAIAYTLLAYSFKLFQLMCTLNFNSLYGLISGVLTRIEALVMVFVVYKLGISLITFMLNPEEASKKGKQILINIFVTAALLLSYNTIFTLFNELSMLIIGTPDNYNYVVLGQVADITGGKDSGLINRVVFGTDEQIPDVGEFIAFSICSTFITDANDPQNTNTLLSELNDKGHINFYLLTNIASKIGKSFDYFYLVGFIGAVYMIYSFIKTTIQVGIRAFKLLILQILAPIAIITVIGEGTKGKTFKNFISKYISVYIEVFVRMFTTLLICNFVVKFIRNIADYFPSISSDEWYTTALMILLIVVAAFKFSGDIPKFIDGILGSHLGDNKGKGGFGHFIGGMLGAGIGLASGLGTGTLAGTIAGVAGGISSGAKGKNVADFFKGQAQNTANARNVAAGVRAVGGRFGMGSLHYAGAKAGGFLGRPQRLQEEGKIASEQQAAMDNMIKTVEDNYDGKIKIGKQEVGLSRDIFRNYAYDEKNTYGFWDDLSEKTQDSVTKTMAAYDDYSTKQGEYDSMRVSGVASPDDLKKKYQEVEAARTAYQSLKASTDKQIDTDYNSKMLRDISEDSEKYVKEKGRSAVRESIKTYDHVADSKFSSRNIADKNKGDSNTKKASDHYATRQDRTLHSRSVTNFNNINTRGGGGGGKK